MFVAGLDEAGRGPLAGPVTAGCVILPDDFPVGILNDSKKLSEKKRESAEKVIIEKACWGLGVVGHEKIDEINILNASLLAMSLAYDDMMKKFPEWAEKNGITLPSDFFERQKELVEAIADGNRVPKILCSVRSEVKADGKFPCVMAASIIAKVERDKMMVQADKLYPQYGYAKHKGYPTKTHKEICRRIGPSPIQRLSFKY
ncbi:MAG: ribonuclease HII [Treponema sp.]|nr:ribonuclease HII [Treponema sp.]